ncbi:hypothetical protein MCETRH20_01582 [Methylophilaceae bacterium]
MKPFFAVTDRSNQIMFHEVAVGDSYICFCRSGR